MVKVAAIFNKIYSLRERYYRASTGKEALIALIGEAEISEQVYNSNAIENSTLTLDETEKILLQIDLDRFISEREIFEAKNLARVVSYINKKAKEHELTLDGVLRLHKMLIANIRDDIAGRFRGKGEYVRVGSHIAPAPEEVVDRLEKMLAEYHAGHHDNVIKRIAKLHLSFEYTHPFVDGNGRIGRVLNNYLLIREGFVPINIKFIDRKRYYDAFTEFDKNGTTSIMEDIVGKALTSSYHKHLAYLEGKKIVTLLDHAKNNKLSHSNLINKANRQTIEAFMEKGVWKIGVMMLSFAALLTLQSCQSGPNFSQGDSMSRDENVLHQNSNQKITLTGVAHDKKGGAVLLTDDGRVITIGGLDAWPEGFSAGARVEATGFLKTIEMPEAEGYDKSGHPTGGAISQGYPQKTKVTVLNQSTWKRIDTDQTPPKDQTIEFVLPLGFVHEGQGTPVLDSDFNPMTRQNLPVIFDGDPEIFLNKLSSPDLPKQILIRAGVHFEKKMLRYRLGASEETGSRSVYALTPKTVLFAKPATKPPEHQHNMSLNKSASPEPDFMAGPALTDAKTIENWIREQSANPARQVRIPVTLEWDGISWQRANLSHMDRADFKIPLQLDDTHLGISLADKLAHLCGSAQTGCALWLEGQFSKGGAAPWPFVISKVHGLQSKGER